MPEETNTGVTAPESVGAEESKPESDNARKLDEKYVFKSNMINSSTDEFPASVNDLDSEVSGDRTNTEYQSDKGYRAITESIITISKDYLDSQNDCKKPLRGKFFNLFSWLLLFQFAFIVVFILLNSFKFIPFDIDAEVLKLYIISVFVETLSAMGVMIAFSFTSSEETKIVGVLNNIVTNYQKVNLGEIQNRTHEDKK